MAGPLRGGGEDRTIKGKRNLILFCCYLKIKDILLRTTFQYCQCWQIRSLLSGLLQYLAKNMALQKLCGGKKLSTSIFGYFKTKKKVPTAIKLGLGRGLGLNGPAIKKIIFFCGFPNLVTMY